MEERKEERERERKEGCELQSQIVRQLHVSHNRFKYIEERLEVDSYAKAINFEDTLHDIERCEYVVDHI